MEHRIGKVFRETRSRREIELSEVEAATRIRPRYLRAIENEEWDVLPGGVYTRGFIRTYGAFLGLDGERLAEDYRESVEGASREWAAAAAEGTSPASGPPSPRRRRGGAPRLGWLAVAAVLTVAAIAIIAIPSGDDSGGREAAGSQRQHSRQEGGRRSATPQSTPQRGVSVRLAAGAEVWVCVLDGEGRHLVNGRILAEGAEAGPFRSGSFTVSFGNGEIAMSIDGQEAEIPTTSSPIGYSIDSSGKLTELSEAERPTCA